MPVPFEMAHDVLIDAPAQLVLDYVSNPQSWKEWCRPMPPPPPPPHTPPRRQRQRHQHPPLTRTTTHNFAR